MKNYKHCDWLHELIYTENLSDEAIYAIYLFLEQILMNFEMRTFHILKRYQQSQENIQEKSFPDDPPF